MPIFVYDVPQYVQLVLPASFATSGAIMNNYPVDRTDFQVVRGVQNQIQFVVRDIDRKFVDTTSVTLAVNLVDTEAETLLLSRTLTVVDPTRSVWQLTLSPADLVDWPDTTIQWSITSTDATGAVSMLWTDRNYSPYSTLTLRQSPFSGPVGATVLDPTTFIILDGWSASSALPGAAQFGYSGATSTFTFYTDSFTGTVRVQGSLQSDASTDETDWFEVASLPLISASGVTPLAVQGNYLWLRVILPVTEVVLMPTLAPVQPPTGTISSIQYRF